MAERWLWVDRLPMVAGVLVMAWLVVSALVAVLIGAGIHVADQDRRRQRSEPFRLP